MKFALANLSPARGGNVANAKRSDNGGVSETPPIGDALLCNDAPLSP